jgi:diguanylate cyclase (GGDEF)-like protein
MFLHFFLIVLEVLFITVLDYKMAASYYSLDVLYCLPVIQTARFSALQTLRRSDSQTLAIIAIFCALAWSLAEAAVSWPNFPISAFLMNVFTRGVTFTVVGRVVTKLWKDKEYSRKDDLTGLANRLELIERFAAKQLQSERSGTPYSLLFINIDHFRALNDKHGHQIGDEALKVLAGTLRENSRSVDTASRMGSDEFVLLFPDTDKQSCELLGARIALAAEEKFNQNGWDISLSFGHVTETGKKRSFDELLRAAGEEMYLSKKNKQ